MIFFLVDLAKNLLDEIGFFDVEQHKHFFFFLINNKYVVRVPYIGRTLYSCLGALTHYLLCVDMPVASLYTGRFYAFMLRQFPQGG